MRRQFCISRLPRESRQAVRPGVGEGVAVIPQGELHPHQGRLAFKVQGRPPQAAQVQILPGDGGAVQRPPALGGGHHGGHIVRFLDDLLPGDAGRRQLQRERRLPPGAQGIVLKGHALQQQTAQQQAAGGDDKAFHGQFSFARAASSRAQRRMRKSRMKASSPAGSKGWVTRLVKSV